MSPLSITVHRCSIEGPSQHRRVDGPDDPRGGAPGPVEHQCAGDAELGQQREVRQQCSRRVHELRVVRSGAGGEGASGCRVVVFVDAFERLKLDPRRTSEVLLNRLVAEMPNVLFVITGRDLVDWYEESRVELEYHGPRCWPGLVPGAHVEPRQHLVGTLSEEDTREVILKARDRFALPISDVVVTELVKASGGLPQYLDLARQVATRLNELQQARMLRADQVAPAVSGGQYEVRVGAKTLLTIDPKLADAERVPAALVAMRMTNRLRSALGGPSYEIQASRGLTSGARTTRNSAALAALAGGDAYCLAGGIMAWKQAGFPTARG